MDTPHAATLIDAVRERVEQQPDRVCFWDETSDGGWRPYTRQEFFTAVINTARLLRSAGVTHGDRVGVLTRPRFEWEVADKAIMYLGGITVGLDYKSSPDDLAYVLTQAGIKALVAEDAAMLELVPPEARAGVPVRYVVDAAEVPVGAESFWDAVNAHAGDPDVPPAARADDVAVLIFTSGTTSNPKGIPLKHHQLVQSIPIMTSVFAEQLEGENRTLAWIPLYNGTGRMMGSINFNLGVEQYFVRDPMTLFEKIKPLKPTYLVLMPRIIEKVYEQVRGKLMEQPAARRWFVQSLLGLRRRLPIAPVLALTDALLVRKLREAIWGEDIKFLISGSAPVDARILAFFGAMGAPTFEVYGMSELAVLISMNRPHRQRYGSVGMPLDGMDVKLADDGEILVHSSAALDAYWGDAADVDLKDDQGYLKTGDLGEFRDGYLFITGRKKEIIKTSTGQRISPVAVENVYRDVPGVESFIVIGDARKYLTALVVMDADFVVKLESEGRAVRDYLDAEFAQRETELGANRRVKRYTVLDEPFSVESGEVTSTMKFRRRVIEEHNAAAIEAMYEGA
ncbi:MAG: AMP-binding protein [Gammaproteobacteria bacterium]|nr:AMP-binding protein [Gammaproteobacteria bacterium]